MKLRTSPPPYGSVGVAIVGIVIAAVGFSGPSHPATWAAIIGGLVIAALAIVLLVWGGEHVVIDVPAGMVHYLPINQSKRASVPIHELGELTIVSEKRDPYKYRHQVLWQRLHASGLGDAVLFASLDRAKVEARKAEIERLLGRGT